MNYLISVIIVILIYASGGPVMPIHAQDKFEEELQQILRNNRREFFRQMSKEAAEQTNKKLGTPSKEELDLIVKDVDYLIQAQKELNEIQKLQQQGLRKIKRQGRINTLKDCLKWGLLIYIALKV